MSAETQQPMSPALSPRAGIAMLTLQLRATTQQAEALEQRYVEIDHDSAKRELRARLEPLIEERTRSFTEAIEAAKVEAAEVIAAAEREAETIRAERRAAAEEAERLAAAEEAERLAAAAALAASIESRDSVWHLDDETLEADDVVEVEEVVELADVEPASDERRDVDDTEVVHAAEVLPPLERPAPTVTSPFARTSTPLPPPQQINVSIDADAFAKVFATVFAAIVEQRLQHVPPAPYLPYAIAPAAPPAPAKQGFWRHARHPDVLLLGLATAIVLVVLAAWLA